MDCLKSFNNTIEYIEDNLEGEISIDKCAEIAACSSSHFQRVFSYLTGFGVAEYIRKRRMTKAGFLLKNTDEKIIDIGLRYGYSSPSSFTRAFKSVHNVTPSQARQKETILKSYPKISFSIDVRGYQALDYYKKGE